MRLLYNFFLALYHAAIHIAAMWNDKARKWVAGRKNIFSYIEHKIGHNEKPLIWFHCASLGEFEQGRPVLELLKEQYPGYKIMLSFYSPSGYEVQQHYAYADYVFYLPADGVSNAKKFIDITKPRLAIFIKYEFWYYYLKTLHEKEIPVLLISAVFSQGQPFFKWYGSLQREMLGFYRQIFVQDETSVKMLKSFFQGPVILAGDTRFDRVSTIKDKAMTVPYMEAFSSGYKVIVAGSTWLQDEAVLFEVIEHINFDGVKLVVAPHEITGPNLTGIRSKLKGSLYYSQLGSDDQAAATRFLVIDNVGMLSRLYQYATVAYVGGGFSKDGIHNVLEPAAWGKPVLFGPNYRKYKEAIALTHAGGGTSFDGSANHLHEKMKGYLFDENELKAASDAAAMFVESNKGATLAIAGYIQENRLLTNL